MKIYFYNTPQRMRDTSKCDSKTYTDYYSDSCYATKSENNNSLVNLAQTYNHNVLLTGDMTNEKVWRDLQDNVLKGIHIDIFKVPHHGLYNCVGNVDPVKKDRQIFDLVMGNKVGNISYYEVTGHAKDKTYDYVLDSNNVKKRSCFSNLGQRNNKKAIEIMCNAYYSLDSNNANVYNITYKTIQMSGGGQGKDDKTLKSICNK